MNPLIISKETWEEIRKRFQLLYPENWRNCLQRLQFTLGRFGVEAGEGCEAGPGWSEKDTVLITYADMVRPLHGAPLEGLRRFLLTHLKGAIKTVHLLPFYPWSSDDGFSVVDYNQVHSDYGDWLDVRMIGEDFDLMFDLVLNHASSQSSWFRNYMNGILPARNYFIEVDPATDLSEVVRPRVSPLLTQTQTPSGTRHVWTTFSADQVDLNWSNPDVFFEFLDILLLYVSQGVRIMRLDAVAFLWKKIGTTCIHLPETHEVIKLYRNILSIVAPNTIILTETNVPHEENISYFGDGDEAHMVYQFSLPPLTLHALLTGSSKWLTEWAQGLPELPEGQCFFNFTASHDGIGVRPLQGILPDSELRFLKQEVESRGGHVSSRMMPDGTESPYELNITYYSALCQNDRSVTGVSRFLCSQTIMLALQGIPGIYFHSLIATPNHNEGVQLTGAARSINRKKFNEAELHAWITEADSPQKYVFETLTTLLRRRSQHPSFHPEAPQIILNLGPDVFALVRSSRDGLERVVCVHNVTRDFVELDTAPIMEHLSGYQIGKDLITGSPIGETLQSQTLQLGAYKCLWLCFIRE